jgi:hypothetical protein
MNLSVKDKIHLESLLLWRVDISDSGCWEWQRARLKAGYGKLKYKQKHYLVHRLAYVLWRGAFSDQQVVCHSCDNPRCCNPQHLFTGSQGDNLTDMRRKWRGYVLRTYKGEESGTAKLTDSLVKSIRQDKVSGATDIALARKYNVSRACVRSVIARKTWKHVG